MGGKRLVMASQRRVVVLTASLFFLIGSVAAGEFWRGRLEMVLFGTDAL